MLAAARSKLCRRVSAWSGVFASIAMSSALSASVIVVAGYLLLFFFVSSKPFSLIWSSDVLSTLYIYIYIYIVHRYQKLKMLNISNHITYKLNTPNYFVATSSSWEYSYCTLISVQNKSWIKETHVDQWKWYKFVDPIKTEQDFNQDFSS